MGNFGLAPGPLSIASTLPPFNSSSRIDSAPARLPVFLNNGFRLVLELSLETAPYNTSSSPSDVRCSPVNECPLPLVCGSICPASQEEVQQHDSNEVPTRSDPAEEEEEDR